MLRTTTTNCRSRPDKRLDGIPPISNSVPALPHTPIYKMHRYFARRPHSVFNELIKHYSNADSIVLDPFCGGGVTVVEGLRLNRKVIGVDLNPMAAFITRMEVTPIDVTAFEEAFHKIENAVEADISELYLTKCPQCQSRRPAEWLEWSSVIECPHCCGEVVLAEANKIARSKYECPRCGKQVSASGKLNTGRRKSDRIVRLKLKCACGFRGEKSPEADDIEKAALIEDQFDRFVKREHLWYPKDEIFEGEKTRELLAKDLKYFHEVFSRRNLLALARLRKAIDSIEDVNTHNMLRLVLSSTLDYSSRISRVVQGQGREITMHAFWLPNMPCENNVWLCFAKRFKAALKGKRYSNDEIGERFRQATMFDDLNGAATCLLLNSSSTALPLPDNSVDAIITDPPYGGNVNYTELSDFWAIWIKDTIGLKEDKLIDSREEAITNKYQGKGDSEYADLMRSVFRECHRCLKPNRWMVMTFNNRRVKIWAALHNAACDAGFRWAEDGMLHQGPIKSYFTPGMLHGRAPGTMLGDFILSYKKPGQDIVTSRRKLSVKPSRKPFPSETGRLEDRVKSTISDCIKNHGSADLSTIYRSLMPFLLGNDLLDDFSEKDLARFLEGHFVKCPEDDKWRLPHGPSESS